jgi:DNA-directed RNA polymerase II subunit RPB2
MDLNNINWKDDIWTIVDSYFRDNKNFLVSHQLDSYNDFISNQIPNIIKSFNPIITFKDLLTGGDNKTYLHEIYVYIGGKEGNEIFIQKPLIDNEILYPNIARLRNYNYSSTILCNVLIEYVTNDKNGRTTQIKELKEISIGKIPIMLQSKYCALYNRSQDAINNLGECLYDPGGYFILGGSEKVITAQESTCNNRIFVTKSEKDKFSYKASIKSKLDNTNDIPKTLKLMILKDYDKINNYKIDTILVSIQGLTKQIPLFILFRALGIESDKEIIKYIFYDIENKEYEKMIEFLRVSILDANQIYDQNSALEYIGLTVKDGNVKKALNIMLNDVFPHLTNDFNVKAYYLGYMTFNLLMVRFGFRNETDRDSYIYRRVELSGYLLSNLFREYYNKFRNELANNLDNEYNIQVNSWENKNKIITLIEDYNKYKIFNPNIIEKGFLDGIRSGVRFGIKPDPLRTNVSQTLNRISYVGFCSSLRRTSTPFDRANKSRKPRVLHGSQWGYMCPCEYPEGKDVGLIKNLALTTNITIECDSKEIKKFLRDYGLIYLNEINPEDISKTVKIFVNGNWLGVHNNIKELRDIFLLHRRNGLINIFTSFCFSIKEMEVNINTDAGRCCRPLLIVNNNKIKFKKDIINGIKRGSIKWQNLIIGFDKELLNYYDCTYYCATPDRNKLNDVLANLRTNSGLIEYIDSEETNNTLISMDISYLNSMTKNYTHMELHPSLILGLLANNIPFINSNQAPRNVFSGAQGKQALSIYASNFRHRMDTMGYLLDYPQRSLVCTRLMNYTNNNTMPNGINAIVAIACYTGYNQEDSIIINKSALDRGLFKTTYYKTIESTEDETVSQEKIIFCNPIELMNEGNDINIKVLDYSQLDGNGFIKENTYVDEDTILIGKCIAKENKKNNFIEDDKIKYKYVDVSIPTPHGYKAIVDKVYVNYDEKNKKMCKIRLRKVKIPMVGDKFCSRAGQKGVIGMVLHETDMPFTKDGIVPDIIINPHALPSRMTIGHLIECILCKSCCELGFIGDSTAFTNNSYEAIGRVLEEKCGFEKNGNEFMYNGMTGEQIETEIFLGPTYYQRLKHMVEDKMFSRNKGPTVLRTRQPAEGRGRGGGLRLGEMERDAILSHGVMHFLRESYMERSDSYTFYVCNKSGTIASVNEDQKIYKSQAIKENTNDFSQVNIPYSMKLLIQELECMSLTPRIVTGNNFSYKADIKDKIDEKEEYDEEVDDIEELFNYDDVGEEN